MTEQTPQKLSPEQEQYLAGVQAATAQLGLDPKNEIHLEAVAATLDQMNKIQALPTDAPEDVQRKNADKLAAAQGLGLNVSGYTQQRTQIEQEAKSAQSGLKTKGIVNFVLSAAASFAAGFYTNKYANSKNWGRLGKWAANIGAFLAAGAGVAQLGYMALTKPSENKLKASIENMAAAETEFDKQLVTAMANHFVKQITEEKAAEAKLHATATLIEATPAHPEHVNKEHPHKEPHENPHHKTDHHAAPQDAHAMAEEAKRHEQIKAEIEAGKERDYPSGKHAAEHHHGNHATDHHDNHHGNHATEQPVVVEREKNIPFTDKLNAPKETHAANVVASKEAAAMQQHFVD